MPRRRTTLRRRRCKKWGGEGGKGKAGGKKKDTNDKTQRNNRITKEQSIAPVLLEKIKHGAKGTLSAFIVDGLISKKLFKYPLLFKVYMTVFRPFLMKYGAKEFMLMLNYSKKEAKQMSTGVGWMSFFSSPLIWQHVDKERGNKDASVISPYIISRTLSKIIGILNELTPSLPEPSNKKSE